MGLQTVKGRFERYDGILDLATQPSIELTIEADSLNANHVKRDEHLRLGMMRAPSKLVVRGRLVRDEK